MHWLDINTIAFTLLNYPISYIELVATLFGLISVYLATRPNIWTWPTGIVNEFGFFILFFQIQLYSDMLLQVYFFVVTVYGWIYWRSPKGERIITTLNLRYRFSLIVAVAISALALGAAVSSFHIWWPSTFNMPADYPYVDAFTTIASIAAMVLMARKIVECWILWVIVDIVSIWLYIQKGVLLIAIEYGIFLALASYGFYRWRKQLA